VRLIEIDAAIRAEIDAPLIKPVPPVQVAGVLPKATTAARAPNPEQHQEHYYKESRNRNECDPMRHQSSGRTNSGRCAGKPRQKAEEHQFSESRGQKRANGHKDTARGRSTRLSVADLVKRFASRSAIHVCQDGVATKNGLDIVSVGIQNKRRVVLRIVLLTHSWEPVRLRASSERFAKERVNRTAGPCPESDMEYRYRRRGHNYSKFPCSVSEAESLSVFGKESTIKSGEHPLIEPATPSEVENRQIEVVNQVETSSELAIKWSDARLRRRKTKLI